MALRLIGILDGDLVASFVALEQGLTGVEGGAVLVDVRDLEIVADRDMHALIEAVRSARAQGRDVRLDARSLPWRRLVKKNLSLMPTVNAELRSDVRRTMIIAHSGKPKGRKRR